MATTTYSLTRDQIIEYALRKLGVLELGESADSITIDSAQTALNVLIKSWITKGIKLWTVNEISIPLVSSQTTYTIGPTGTTPTPDVVTDKPQKLIQAWIRDTSVSPNRDIPLQKLSEEDYNVLGSKFSTGTPNSVYLDVNRDNSTLYTYLTPDTYSGTNYQIHIVTQRLLQDADYSAASLDFPQEWLRALGWNLAFDLASDYVIPDSLYNRIEREAAKLLDEVEGWDVEYGSVYLAPDTRTMSPRLR